MIKRYLVVTIENTKVSYSEDELVEKSWLLEVEAIPVDKKEQSQ